MRTTLDIDEDVLLAAKAMARERRQSTGKVLSDLARQGFSKFTPGETRNGIMLLPVRDPTAVVTMELVNELRDEYP